MDLGDDCDGDMEGYDGGFTETALPPCQNVSPAGRRSGPSNAEAMDEAAGMLRAAGFGTGAGHICHNRTHPSRPATRQIMGYWWCGECADEATELFHPGANLPVHRPGDPGPPVPEEVIVKHLRDAGYQAGVRFGAAGMARLEAQRPDFAVWLAEEIDPDEAGQICKAIFDRLGDLGVDVDRVEHKGGDDHR
jgi:hypothetical protein